MTWLLNPALFWFLPLAAVPILLHLLTLHRLKTVELSTYRFLFDSYVQQRRRMKFLEALLAALRTLFILFLVVAFSRPLVKNFTELFQLGSGREVVMLVDCSASMSAATGGLTALDRAKAAALRELHRMDANHPLTLMRVGARTEEVFSRFTSDKDEIRNKIDELKVGPSRANFFAALSELYGPSARARAKPLVYLFTDCQLSGWREVRNQGLERIVPADAEIVVVNAGAKAAVPNMAVIGSSPPREHAIVGLPVYLYPRVVNHRLTQAEVTISVVIDEKEVGRTKMSLKPGEDVRQRVIYFPTETGMHRGRFEITSNATDGFPDDNRFDFTLSVVPRPKVIVVNGNPVTNEHENDGYYLRAALKYPAADDDKEAKSPERRAEREFAKLLNVQEISEANLNPGALKDVSVVILANCGGLGPEHFTWLRDFVAGGGGLLIFLGSNVDPALYNDQFFQLPGSVGERLTDVRLGTPEGDLEKAETFERLTAIDFAHPVMEVYDPKKKPFSTVRFYRRFPLLMPVAPGAAGSTSSPNAIPLASFANGKPALVESRFGDGVVFLSAFPASAHWTNLPTRGGANFFPLVTRLVTHARRRPEVDGPSVVPPDGSAEFVVNGAWNTAHGTVTDPTGKSIPIEFSRSGNRLVGSLDRADVRGFYSVKVQGGRPDQPKQTVLAFAVNLAPEESEPALIEESGFREMLPGKVHFLDATADAQQQHSADDQVEIYRWLIYLVFVIIGVEFLLATLGGGAAKDGEEPPTVSARIRDIGAGAWIARMTGAARHTE